MWGRRTEKGDIRMCQKIKEVNSLTPEEILKEHWDKKVPVNVKQILAGIGVRFREHDLSNLEHAIDLDKTDAILGVAFSDGDDLGILYSCRIDKDATNYVLAHELAHCCLHMKPSEEFHVELKCSKDLYSRAHGKSVFSGYKNSYKEVQADKFAADLLIPTEALFEILASEAQQSVESIAKYFHVSKEIVRLKVMNIRRYKVGEAK